MGEWMVVTQSSPRGAKIPVLHYPYTHMGHANSSIWKLLVPREHGSWGLWITPMVSAAIVALIRTPAANSRHDWLPAIAPLLWFALASALAFMVYQPLEELMGLSLFKLRAPQEKRAALLWIAGFGLLALAAFIIIYRMHREKLLWLALLAAVCFGARAAMGMDRRFRVLKELIGALALSSTSVGSYYCVWGLVDQTAIGLWIASWLFAVGQIEYVQLRIHTAAKPDPQRARKVLAFHLLLPTAIVAAWSFHRAPLWMIAAFAPAIIRILAWRFAPPQKLNVRRLGVTELLLGITFGLLLAGAYVMGR
jgi:hypothetical protein